jgi:hypothetical protein
MVAGTAGRGPATAGRGPATAGTAVVELPIPGTPVPGRATVADPPPTAPVRVIIVIRSDPPAATDPTDPTAVNNAVDFAAQQAYDAVANPFGGVPGTVALQNTIATSAGAEPVPGSPGVSRNPGNPGSPGNPSSPGREPNSAPPPPTAETPAKTRAEIHAVIVSGLADPSQVLRGNVHLTGGIVALGSPDSSAPQPPGRWDPNVKITPEPELLNGQRLRFNNLIKEFTRSVVLLPYIRLFSEIATINIPIEPVIPLAAFYPPLHAANALGTSSP